VSVDRLPDAAYLGALAGLPAMGPSRLRALLAGRSPAEAWAACAAGRTLPEVAAVVGGRAGPLVAEWARAVADEPVADRWRRVADAGLEVLAGGGRGLPRPLDIDPDPPAVLFADGTVGALDVRPRVAVVGTRRCTRYGTEVARHLGRALARAGCSVVSGLAVGIDAAAHLGALAAEGAPPVAVVASGLDVVYPPGNRGLWQRVVEHGVVVSEYPPGVAPARWRFPARNRIIAGLADALVVVESHAEGGSLHTVDAALERDRPVFVVPGPIRSPASAGTNRLLADGAQALCTVDDLLDGMGLVPLAEGRPDVAAQPVPDPDQALVLDALGWRPATLSMIAERCALAPVAVAAALGALVRSGTVTIDRGFYERSDGSP